MSRVVPIVDLTTFRNGTDKTAVVRSVGSACATIGFLVVSGHGIPQPMIDAVLDAARRFFSLPAEIKAAVRPADPAVFRGYQAVEAKSLGRSLGTDAPADLRESFTINRVQDKSDPYFRNPAAGRIFAENVWPEESLIPGFRSAFIDYYLAMEQLATTLMRIFALALDLPESFFDDKIDKHFTNCAAYHYPPLTRAPKPGQLRGGAHTDFGSLTVVLASPSARGLQVWNGGEWEDVPVVSGTFIVNLGDLMAQWTNDRWVSTLHRVANPPEGEWSASRYSITFFHQPNYDVLVESLDRVNPPKHAPETSGAHLVRKLTAMRVKAQGDRNQ
jgi:isopenicillin N synthase-like dioxygenase